MTELQSLQAHLLTLRERGVAEALLYRIEALLRRMLGQDAAMCAALEPRLHALLERAENSPQKAKFAMDEVQANPLADLLQTWVDANKNDVSEQAESSGAALVLPAIPMLEDARRIWRAVRARSQLRESLAQPQEHAGPLNSGRLVLRMIDTMQAASPDYLECLLTYIDVLAALEPLVAATAQGSVDAVQKRAARTRKRRE